MHRRRLTSCPIAPAAIWLLAVAILLGSGATAFAQSSGDLVRIDPEAWQLHFGDDPACVQPGSPGCAWRSLRKMGPELTTPTVHVWRSAVVEIPPDLRASSVLAVAVLNESVNGPYEVFVNGRRIGGQGDLQRGTGLWDPNAVLKFPSALLTPGPAEIVIHSRDVRGMLYRQALENANVTVGSPASCAAAEESSILQSLIEDSMYYLCFLFVFCAGIFFLLLYTLDQRGKEHLWLGLLLVGIAGRRACEFFSSVQTGAGLRSMSLLYVGLDALAYLGTVRFPFALIDKPLPRSLRVIQFLGFTEVLDVIGVMPLSASAFAHVLPVALWLDKSEYWSLLATHLLLLVPVPSYIRSPLPEMRWIGGALIFVALEDTSRFLRSLNRLGLSRALYFTQNVEVHGINIDFRAFAYLLFGVVMAVSMLVRFRRVQRKNLVMEGELAAARSLQHVLIPEQLPLIPGLLVESAYLPMQEVGGDFFQVILPEDGRRGYALVVVGDVSGKGLPAAMTVSVIVGAIRTLAEFCASPAEILAGLNRRLMGRGGFATCVVLRVELRGDAVVVANAGHLNPYLDGVEVATAPELPLGVEAEATYPETTLRLSEGQTLTLLSDGVVEATDVRSRELFGFERAAAISGQMAEAIAQRAQQFGQNDDITVVRVRRVAVPEPAARIGALQPA